jgi:hypothetical protein
MLSEYDIVIINPDYADCEAAGKRGHVIGMVEGDGIGVFVYDMECVWCMTVADVTPTGERDTEAAQSRGAPIRVSVRGEVLD